MALPTTEAIYSAVLDLQARYAITLDHQDGGGLEQCFVEDATLAVGGIVQERGAAAIAQRLVSRSSASVMHLSFVTTVRQVAGDTAHATSYFALVDTADGETTALGEYVDEIDLDHEGCARFRAREVTYRWRRH
jgi:hypothetical protein